jgi:hypothetical protein
VGTFIDSSNIHSLTFSYEGPGTVRDTITQGGTKPDTKYLRLFSELTREDSINHKSNFIINSSE